MPRIVPIALVLGLSVAFTHPNAAEPVTPDTFVRAETDTYFKKKVDSGGLGRFIHFRTLTPIDAQNVIRMNRDTLYSSAVFDLTTPVTISKPDTGNRYQSIQVINQDHFTKLVVHEPGPYTLTMEAMGTRYVFVIIRTWLEPTERNDIKIVHAAQDAVTVEQESVGKFEAHDWDQKSLARLRDALLVLGSSGLGDGRSFGDRGEVDPIWHLIATAAAWGGLPKSAAMYVSVTPEQNDGTVPHTLTVKDVPVDSFWSVSVYNEKGYFEKNDQDAYTINDRSAKKNADGSVTIHFGGDPTHPNYLYIMKGWNYTVRMYRPRNPVLDGSFVFPKAMPSR
jgi:hypothetical protein